jgi:hypothetical protein
METIGAPSTPLFSPAASTMPTVRVMTIEKGVTHVAATAVGAKTALQEKTQRSAIRQLLVLFRSRSTDSTPVMLPHCRPPDSGILTRWRRIQQGEK